MSLPEFTAARSCLTLSALVNILGQTMSTGLCLGLLALYYTWRSTPMPGDSLKTAAIMNTVYWVTALSGILYPGALAVDPEFGEGFPQFWPFLGLAGLPWLGYFLAR